MKSFDEFVGNLSLLIALIAVVIGLWAMFDVIFNNGDGIGRLSAFLDNFKEMYPK